MDSRQPYKFYTGNMTTTLTKPPRSNLSNFFHDLVTVDFHEIDINTGMRVAKKMAGPYDAREIRYIQEAAITTTASLSNFIFLLHINRTPCPSVYTLVYSNPATNTTKLSRINGRGHKDNDST